MAKHSSKRGGDASLEQIQTARKGVSIYGFIGLLAIIIIIILGATGVMK